MSIKNKLSTIRHLINTLAKEAGRNPTDVKLLAVTKGQPVEILQQVFAAGYTDFAENYWQEALEKIQALANLPITWHFIGHLQSNKIKKIAQYVDWIHSVYREEELTLLAKYRPISAKPLQVCIQVKVDHALGHHGVSEEEVTDLILKAKSLERIQVRGLMVMLKPDLDEATQFAAFSKVKHLLNRLNAQHNLRLDTLSMGMSGDMKQAIRAGCHWLRLGRIIFQS